MSIVLFCTLIVFTLLAGALFSANYLYNNPKIISKKYFILFLILSFISLYGLTYNNLKNETEILRSQLAIMSQSMAALKHYNIDSETSENDVQYLKMIETEKNWTKTSGQFFDDIYTMRKDSNDNTIFIVDSETDYDHDGKYNEDRESRTKIGEIYDKKLPELSRAFTNKEFDYTQNFYTDKWGTWFSAFYPITDIDGNFDGLIGADVSLQKIAIRFLRDNLLTSLGLFVLYIAILFLLKNQKTDQLLNLNLKSYLSESENNLKYQKQFLAVMSHEIRTPLNAIIGSIQLIDSDKLSLIDSENLNNARQSSHILTEIIGDILDYSKIESGKINLDRSEVHFPKLLMQIKNLFKKQMMAKNINLDMQIDVVTMHSYYGLDETRIRQILTNFISNAYKFTNNGSIRLSLKAIKTETFSTLLEFRITDTGIGISLADQKKLFQAFQQADSSITRKFGGTGLGLVIAKNLIELMGGQIYFDSQPGKGSTFVFTIMAENIIKNAISLEAEQNSQKFVFEKYSELKILVVDDVLMNQVVLVKTLNKIGFQADSAIDGSDALRKHESEKYDIIFMDCQMPVMDGLQATKLIRKNEITTSTLRKTHIVALTANATTDDKNDCLSAGMDQFISKPFTLSQIETALQFAIQQTETSLYLKRIA